MFGYVTANLKELTKESQARYQSVYCGICKGIRQQSSQIARLSLSYDMAFLSLLLMSLYEPEEQTGGRGCILHPVKSKNWLDNTFIRYGADMNVALAYYKALDDYNDEGRLASKALAGMLKKDCEEAMQRYPRQCQAIAACIAELSGLEKSGCPNPDEPAGCFGQLMGELLVYEEDLWAPTLRKMGQALGRYIYLADAAVDYRKDKKTGSYNPYIAMGMEEDRKQFEQYLLLTMARCTDYYERLPLVQDKDILDNILYSGIWVEYRRKMQEPKGSREDQKDG